MNFENMNELIESLLARDIIKPKSIEYFDKNALQYVLTGEEYLITYSDDFDNKIEIIAFAKDCEGNWYGYDTEECMIVLENVIYTCVCDVNVWHKC
jgi:hypothetical protein